MRTHILLDSEGEDFALKNGWDTVVPLSFTVTEENGLSVEVYPRALDIAEAFCRDFATRPCSRAALSFLSEALSRRIADWGYRREPRSSGRGYILRANKVEQIKTKSLAEEPFLLAAKDEERNCTTYDIEAVCAAGHLAYGIEKDGRILSVAVAHASVQEADTVIEVGVETVPLARGRGYAAACLAALSADILRGGVAVEYRHRSHNLASRRTALSAGFREVGSFYYFVGRKVYSHGI